MKAEDVSSDGKYMAEKFHGINFHCCFHLIFHSRLALDECCFLGWAVVDTCCERLTLYLQACHMAQCGRNRIFV